mgnify:CR=1 FL=1
MIFDISYNPRQEKTYSRQQSKGSFNDEQNKINWHVPTLRFL